MGKGEAILRKVNIKPTQWVKCASPEGNNHDDFMFLRKSIMGGDTYIVASLTEKEKTNSLYLDNRGAMKVYDFVNETYCLQDKKLQAQKKMIEEWVMNFEYELRKAQVSTDEGAKLKKMACLALTNLRNKIKEL